MCVYILVMYINVKVLSCIGQVGCCAKTGVISLPPLSDSNTPLPPPPSLRLLLQNKDSRNVYCHLTCLIFMSSLIVIFMFNYNSSWQRYRNATGFISMYSISNMCLSVFGVANYSMSSSSLTVILKIFRSCSSATSDGLYHRQRFKNIFQNGPFLFQTHYL